MTSKDLACTHTHTCPTTTPPASVSYIDISAVSILVRYHTGLEGDDLGKTWSGNVPERDGALPSSSRNGYDERLPPFFVGEDIGNSSLPGGAGQGGGRAHAVIPRVRG